MQTENRNHSRAWGWRVIASTYKMSFLGWKYSSWVCRDSHVSQHAKYIKNSWHLPLKLMNVMACKPCQSVCLEREENTHLQQMHSCCHIRGWQRIQQWAFRYVVGANRKEGPGTQHTAHKEKEFQSQYHYSIISQRPRLEWLPTSI